MGQTITDYYPAYLTSSSVQEGKDFPCNPEFSSGVPDGYDPPTPRPTPSTPDSTPIGCSLEEGQCDTHDTSGCTCQNAELCCQTPEKHGCGGAILGDGTVGGKQCLPCSWSGFEWTSASCNRRH